MATARGNNRLDQRPQGAYISLDALINARLGARDLKLQQRRRALSQLAGPNTSNFRGRGLDFAEVRAYQPGDDIRSIDWRVTARSDRTYTKLFEEERERPLLIATDQRQPMFFGSRYCFKSVTACYASALLAWAGLANGDRVGGLVFGNPQAGRPSHSEVRPRRSRQAVLTFNHHLQQFNHALNRDSGIGLAARDTLSQSLMELRRIVRPGSSLFLISDFAGFDAGDSAKHLHQLSRHCEITALFIYDPLEQTLPPPGRYLVSDGRSRQLLETGDRRTQIQYQQQFGERRESLRQHFGRLGIPMIELATVDAPLSILLRFYGSDRRQPRGNTR